MDIAYTLWEKGLEWFDKAPGGVNRWSVGAFLLMLTGISLMGYYRVRGGFNGSGGQLVRFAGGVFSFIFALAGGGGFLLVAGGAFDAAPLGKEALACALTAAVGAAGVALALVRERANNEHR